MKPIAIGTDDFKEIIENGSLFIDKTLFIKDIIDNSTKVLLFPRPRRFGKTLNISMLRYYFDNTLKSKNLFKDLSISKQEGKYQKEMNKYPVISLTFKDLKRNSYQEFIMGYKNVMSNLYIQYKYILESDKIENIEKEYFTRIIDKKEEIDLQLALANLVYMLEKYYNEQVIVLLDEYDAPILNGYLNNYYEEIITFMKQVFVTTFKNNLSLKKGIITGILRISKENMFSDANNISVYNITDSKYSTYFGFTEEEVKEVLGEYKLSETFEEVKKWYDGYLFNKTIIYNPWSILNYLANEEHELRQYWVATGGVDLLKNLIYKFNNDSNLISEYHRLIETNEIQGINLDLYMDLKNLDADENTIWTLFMLCGYLTPGEYTGNLKNVTLRIPNLEVKENLESVAREWFKDEILPKYKFIDYLLRNDMDMFKSSLKEIALNSFSYYDIPKNSNGENFYHAFMMGILYSGNNDYEITSNRESGYGRYDLMLKPISNKSNHAYIIEFKLVRDGDFKKTIEEGFNQIEENKYTSPLKDYEVTKMVIAFKGKKVEIETKQ